MSFSPSTNLPVQRALRYARRYYLHHKTPLLYWFSIVTLVLGIVAFAALFLSDVTQANTGTDWLYVVALTIVLCCALMIVNIRRLYREATCFAYDAIGNDNLSPADIAGFCSDYALD